MHGCRTMVCFLLSFPSFFYAFFKTAGPLKSILSETSVCKIELFWIKSGAGLYLPYLCSTTCSPHSTIRERLVFHDHSFKTEQRWMMYLSNTYVTDTLLNILQILAHLILRTTLIGLSLFPSFYSWSKWGTEKLYKLPKITQLLNGWARTVLFQGPCLYPEWFAATLAMVRHCAMNFTGIIIADASKTTSEVTVLFTACRCKNWGKRNCVAFLWGARTRFELHSLTSEPKILIPCFIGFHKNENICLFSKSYGAFNCFHVGLHWWKLTREYLYSQEGTHLLK